MFPPLSRIFLILGVIFLAIGGLIFFFSRLHIPLGRLPGDIVIQGKNLTCFIPLGTSILLSVVLTIVLTLLARFAGRK
jgi:Protein of unknown function (DUF2905)